MIVGKSTIKTQELFRMLKAIEFIINVNCEQDMQQITNNSNFKMSNLA